MKNKIILLLTLLLAGNVVLPAQWNPVSTVNTPVSVQQLDQHNVDMVPDGKGGAILAWVDNRTSLVQSDIYVQRLNAQGVALWTTNGIGVCTDAANQTSVSLIEDGNGGAFLVWNDYRTGNRDVYAQWIDSTGASQWAAGGLAVCTKPGEQRSAKHIADGSGGIIVVWEDSTSSSDWDVYAQRVSSGGSLSWPASGVAICTSASTQLNPRIATDGAGGGIIVWQDKRNGADNDIWCQRINGAGVVQWAANGVFVSSAQYSQKNPKIKPDGAGGAIMAWQDARNNGTDSSGIFAQRVSGTGSMLWTANGVSVCTAIGGQAQIELCNDGVNGIIIIWRDKRNGVDADIYAQRLDLNGSAQWTANGVIVCGEIGDQENPNACGDGNGGAIICWEDTRSGTWDIYTQRLDASGTLVWASSGIAVGNATDDQMSSKNISDGNGGSIYAWEDFRNGNDFNVYAHHLFADGSPLLATSGDFPVAGIAQVYPNPLTRTSVLSVDSELFRKGPLTLQVTDISGKILHQVELGSPVQAFPGQGLRSGTYFYTLSSQGVHVANGRVLVIGEN